MADNNRIIQDFLRQAGGEEVLIMIRSEETCSVCRQGKVFTTCIDCKAALCEQCARFELLAEGCGTVVPAYFCPACAVDVLINPNAVFRQGE